MKKLIVTIILTMALVSISAQAVPPTAPGTWKGTYGAIAFPFTNNCQMPKGTELTLVQLTTTVDNSKGITTFKGTLKLDGYSDTNTQDPQFQNPVPVTVTINQSGGATLVTTEGTGAYLDSTGYSDTPHPTMYIFSGPSGGLGVGCMITTSSLTYTAD